MEDFEETKQEETLQNQQETEFETLIITEDIRSYIYETAKWTKFLSIVGFVFTGLIALSSFSSSAFISYMSSMVGEANNPYAKMGSGALTVIFLFLALFYFYPSLMLFKYGSSAKTAVLFGDQNSLSLAMSKMKSFFKFLGVFTIVIIAFYVIILLLVAIQVSASAAG